MYNYFAKYYDTLMADFPYDIWESFVLENLDNKHQLIDIGCGTGTLLKRLEKHNYSGYGLDISIEMLVIAQEKCKSFKFFEYDISEPLLINKEMAITCFVDSINYITKQEEVVSFFKNVYDGLAEGGKFLIDYHTVKKINEVFVGHEEYQELDDCEFFWDSVKGPFENSCLHKLEFVSEGGSYYEEHVQISFGDDFYINALKEVGFNVQIDSRSDEMRIFAICNK